LFAAGDAATRELICGGFTGGGSHNAAWAMSSGYWSGESAALFSRRFEGKAGTRNARPVGQATLRTDHGSAALDIEGVVRGVQGEVYPYDKNLFRTQEGLARSRASLEDLWTAVQARPEQRARTVVRAREAAAMVATARWMYASAEQRRETRGMHKHQDFPTLDATQQHRIVSGGLDRVWARPEVAPTTARGAGGVEEHAA
jgi:succinate dehydrogenase/fumarate reductase flavoprotein subunit